MVCAGRIDSVFPTLLFFGGMSWADSRPLSISSTFSGLTISVLPVAVPPAIAPIELLLLVYSIQKLCLSGLSGLWYHLMQLRWGFSRLLSSFPSGSSLSDSCRAFVHCFIPSADYQCFYLAQCTMPRCCLYPSSERVHGLFLPIGIYKARWTRLLFPGRASYTL